MFLIITTFVILNICFADGLESFTSSIYQASSDRTCDTVKTSGQARSLVDCMVRCSGDQKGCYSKDAMNCICCSSTTTGSANVLTEESACFQLYRLCPPGWIIVQDSCVFTYPFPASFSDCQEICSGSTAKVLEVVNEDESDAITAYLLGNPGPQDLYWNGLVYKTTGLLAGNWVTAFTGQPVTWSYWAFGEPNGISLNELCLLMVLSNDCKWFDAPCSMTASCVCQKET